LGGASLAVRRSLKQGPILRLRRSQIAATLRGLSGSEPAEPATTRGSSLRIKWSAPALVAALALFVVSGATAAWVASPLDAEMTVGEAYTLPTQTVLAEAAPGDIGFGTLTLNAPPGFEFDTKSKATASVADDKSSCNEATALRLGIQPAASQTVTPEATKITFLVSSPSRGRCTGFVSFSNVVVKPLEAGSGNVTLGGTSRVRGLPAGSTLGYWTARKPTPPGAPLAWGSNVYGELGQGFSGNPISEPQVVDLGSAVAIAAGDYDSFAVLGDGTVWGWGMDSAGALGDGGSGERDSPVQATGVTNAMAVSAGYGHTLALRSDGSLWAWGGNWDGMLGDGTTDSSLPKPVPGLSGVLAAKAGRESSYAVTGDGTLWAWGGNVHGQLGTGDTDRRLVPTAVLTGVRSVAAGDYSVLALKEDGTVWGAGNNDYGQLGIGAQTPDRPTFVQSAISGVTSIAAGDISSFGTTSDGAAWGWGSNGFGELGLGFTSEAVPTPTPVPSLTGVKEFGAGEHHTLALGSDGTVWAFGSNYYGQLGVGNDLGDYYTAVPVRSHVSAARHVAARELHSLATG
jgi:alpha-tubulin suppressor-like RCC1 family protein